MSDPPGRRSEAFLGGVKRTVANLTLNIHPKGKRMIDLDTFRRASISLNRDNQAIQLIEGMAESEAEKLMILDFTQPGNAAPDGPGGLPFREWYRTVTSQMPAVLYRLL